MSIVNSPPTTPVDTQDEQGKLRPPSEGWRGFFNAVFNICNSLTESGDASQRPVKFMWPGRRFFDITLGTAGEPIWRNKDNTGWVGLGGGGGSGVTNVATTSPITGGPITSTGTIGINNAAADGVTLGAAAFTAADFNAAVGVISIDYVNGQKATAAVPGFLTAADWSTFNSKGSGTVTSIATTSPITGGTIVGSGTIAINDAAADGINKGAAAFTAADFNSASGVISIDYTNGQKATSLVPGFLTSADWIAFNAKGSAIYEVGGGCFGAPPANVELFPGGYPFTRTVVFASGLSPSQGSAASAATAQTDFDIKKNGVSVGTMRFAAAGTVASFIMASQTTFNAGDLMRVVGPITPDATLANLSFVLAGTR